MVVRPVARISQARWPGTTVGDEEIPASPDRQPVREERGRLLIERQGERGRGVRDHRAGQPQRGRRRLRARARRRRLGVGRAILGGVRRSGQHVRGRVARRDDERAVVPGRPTVRVEKNPGALRADAVECQGVVVERRVGAGDALDGSAPSEERADVVRRPAVGFRHHRRGSRGDEPGAGKLSITRRGTAMLERWTGPTVGRPRRSHNTGGEGERPPQGRGGRTSRGISRRSTGARRHPRPPPGSA